MVSRSSLGTVHWLGAALLLSLALLLGGGQGTLGDTACQLLALGLIATSVLRHMKDPAARLPRWAWLAALPLCVPLLQLVPVPASAWQTAAARTELTAQLATIGVEPSHRFTLVPLATERAMFWLLPAVAMFLAGLQLGRRQRAALLVIFVAGAVASVLLGLAQLTEGTDSPLRFYTVTNTTEAVGFFANRNHFASLLAMALPFVLLGAASWVANRRDTGRAPLVVGAFAAAGMAALLILGIALAGSRAGLGLGVLVGALSVLTVLLYRSGRGGVRTIVLALAAGLVLSLPFALPGILQLAKADPMADARFEYAPLAMAAAADHAPFGSGLGGFRRAFEPYDPTPDVVYVNHAHNDYVEAWFEARWLALAVALVLLPILVRMGWTAWRSSGRRPVFDTMIARASCIGLCVPLLHSLVDYPLRTTSVLAVSGLLVALLRDPAPAPPSA